VKGKTIVHKGVKCRLISKKELVDKFPSSLKVEGKHVVVQEQANWSALIPWLRRCFHAIGYRGGDVSGPIREVQMIDIGLGLGVFWAEESRSFYLFDAMREKEIEMTKEWLHATGDEYARFAQFVAATLAPRLIAEWVNNFYEEREER
jgi:hypothetical protein